MKLRAEKITIHIAHKVICADFNIEILPGEIWGILGQNGRGKTTLLHALGGFYPISKGAIWLGDEKINTLSPLEIAKQLAILFQDTHFIFPQTVWDFCLDGRFPHRAFLQKESKHDREIAYASLALMDLLHLKKKSITQLSGGEKRRLAIAAVLTQTPKIYLVDEPINHLDIAYQIKVLQHFRYLAQEKSASIVCTLHDMNLAQQFCNRILLLFPEGDFLSGTPQEVLTPEHLTRVYQHRIEKITGDYLVSASSEPRGYCDESR